MDNIDLALDVFAVAANDLVEHVDVHPPSRPGWGALLMLIRTPSWFAGAETHGRVSAGLVFGVESALGLKTFDPCIVAMHPRS